VFAGRVGARNLVAAPWAPDPSLDAGDGKVRGEYMWAVLDCPGYFAARDDRRQMLLGEFTAHVERRVHIDEPCVVIGWPISVSGRKYDRDRAVQRDGGAVCAGAQPVDRAARSP
jgi:hypothetical protein